MIWFPLVSVLGLMTQQVAAAPEGSPVPPTLHIQQQVQLFVKGEMLELVCVAEGAKRGRRFHLYRENEGTLLQTQRAASWSLFVIFQLQELLEVGTQRYSCSYWAWAPGSDIQSARSEPVSITIIERPPKPSIGPEGPYRVFVDGESVRVICTAPSVISNGTFLLYQNNAKNALTPHNSPSPNRSVTFDISQILGVATREYSCSYLTQLSEREIEAERSDPVKISVEGRLVKPHLYLEGVNITFEVGDSVRLVCDGGLEDRDSTFYLYRRAEQTPLMSQTPDDWLFSVVFDVEDILTNGTEHYCCAYQRQLSERWVLSERSNSLAITAHNPLSKPELVLNIRTGSYWKGQSMRMTCRGDVQEPLAYFYFYQDGQPAKTGEPHSFQTVQILGSNRGGLYQCKYAMDTPGKWFQSPLSDGVRVTEIGDLRRPSIALERDDEVFGAKRSVTVTCEAPPQESGRKFYLYRNGETLPLLREKARRGSLSVTFELTGRLRSGTEYYQCAYRRKQGAVERFSERSHSLEINN